MKILMINVVCGIRSTGRICTDLASLLEEKGHCVKVLYGREKVPDQFKKYAVRIGNDWDIKLHGVKARLFDAAGYGSKWATKKMIKWIDDFDPDIIHLHNIHGYYINIDILFSYIKKKQKRVFWSFYDCWPFTGHCAHFDFNQCTKWMTKCEKCEFITEYPKAYFDFSKRNYIKKMQTFADLKNFKIIAPSIWMSKMIKKSFFEKYDIRVIPNGVDLEYFKPKKSIFRKKYQITDKMVILGVSSFWNEMKGIDSFFELRRRLSTEDFSIVMVGKIASNVKVPEGIIHISQTDDIESLCELYTMADCFFNPTLQETQGLTTLEAFACGTPAIVYNSGGAPECVNDKVGVIVEKNDIENVVYILYKIKNKEICFAEKDCIEVAKEYEKRKKYDEIIKLYEEDDSV